MQDVSSSPYVDFAADAAEVMRGFVWVAAWVFLALTVVGVGAVLLNIPDDCTSSVFSEPPGCGDRTEYLLVAGAAGAGALASNAVMFSLAVICSLLARIEKHQRA